MAHPQPQDPELDQACYYVSGRIPIQGTGNDWNIPSILLDSGANANFVSEALVTQIGLSRNVCPDRHFSMANGKLMKVNSFVIFPLFIGGVFSPSIKAYVEEGGGDNELNLGMPGWDAFLISMERVSYPARETITTVAERVDEGPEKRFVVPNVGQVQTAVTAVLSDPAAGARIKGEELEDSRWRKHMERADYLVGLVRQNAGAGVARARAIDGEVKAATHEMQAVVVEKPYSVRRFLNSLRVAREFVRNVTGGNP